MSGPSHWTASITAVRRVGLHAVVTLAAPGVADQVRPGQYAAVAVGGSQSSLLMRRALWIAGSAPTGHHGGVIDVVANAREVGGKWLAEQARGVTVDVIAPLGRPFSLPVQPASCLLVGFGGDAAALLRLGELLVSRGCRVEFLLLTAPGESYGSFEARRIGTATRSESLAPSGLRADRERHLGRAISRALTDSDADVVYSAGPAADLAVVAAAVGPAPHQVAWSSVSVCGSGTCAACAVPIRGTDQIARIVRACAEGPVFDAGRIMWDDLGNVPGDCLAAAGNSETGQGA